MGQNAFGLKFVGTTRHDVQISNVYLIIVAQQPSKSTLVFGLYSILVYMYVNLYINKCRKLQKNALIQYLDSERFLKNSLPQSSREAPTDFNLYLQNILYTYEYNINVFFISIVSKIVIEISQLYNSSLQNLTNSMVFPSTCRTTYVKRASNKAFCALKDMFHGLLLSIYM